MGDQSPTDGTSNSAGDSQGRRADEDVEFEDTEFEDPDFEDTEFDDDDFEDETLDSDLLESLLREAVAEPIDLTDRQPSAIPDVDDWLDEWEDDRTDPKPITSTPNPKSSPRSTADSPSGTSALEPDGSDVARRTQKLPPFDRQSPPQSNRSTNPVTQPPAVTARSQRGADSGKPPSSTAPSRPARRTAKVPSPPLVRTASRRPVSEPPTTPASGFGRGSEPPTADPSGSASAGTEASYDPVVYPSLMNASDQALPDESAHDLVHKAAVQTSSRSIKLGGIDVTVGATRKSILVAVGSGLAIVVALVGYVLLGLTGETRSAFREPETAAVIAGDSTDLNASNDSPPVQTIAELAKATVQIVGLDDNDTAVCAGSGVLVGEEGVILTNAHVVTAGEGCEFSSLGIAVTHDTSDPPSLTYLAEVLVTDRVLDLAVLRIVGPLSRVEGLEIPPNFPTAVLGDSDEVELGDEIRILGYPVIGGETITSTTGSVSGFSSQLGIGSRALIKTDAAISAGNSGGMALNESGQVVGIPTRARATESGPAVDCRALSDTNADGQINDDDNCVPVGGFLNGVRPINLADDLLARAAAMQQSRSQDSAEAATMDISTITVGNARFSTGVEENNPVDEVLVVRQGEKQICLFVDWAGIPNGVAWAAVWSLDGEQIADFGIYDGTWEFGESGRNFWYCAEDPDGHKVGTYEVGFFVDNQLAFVEAIQVTDADVEEHEVTWVNKTDQDLCGLAVNPFAVGRHAGVNELETGEIIEPGASTTLTLPAGVVVVEAYNCRGEAIAAELDGLVIPRDMFVDGNQVPFVIGGQESAGG